MNPEFTVGKLVNRTLQAWWKNLVPFTVLGLVAMAPMVIAMTLLLRQLTTLGVDYSAADGAAEMDLAAGQQRIEQMVSFGGWVAAAGLASAVLYVIQIAAVASGTFSFLKGARAPFGSMLATGLRRGLPALVVGLVVWLGVVAGTMMIFVPGMWFACATAVAIPVAVAERGGIGRAISRSFQLTSGYRWRIFAGFLALFGILWFLSACVQLAVGSVAALMPASAPTLLLAGSQLGNAAFSSIIATGLAVAYHELRVAKEGLDSAQLAAIFD